MSTHTTPSRKLVFVSTTRLHYDAEGRLRSYNPLLSAKEWAPFVEHFKDITILARVDRGKIANEGYLLGETTLKVVPIPFYDGMLDYYRKSLVIKRFVSKYLQDPTATYYVWVPSALAFSATRQIRKIGAPLLVRVMGDPGGVARAILPFPVNLIAAKSSERSSQKAVEAADGVIYVTLESLQKKYPPRSAASVLARTNIQFSPELLSIHKKTPKKRGESGAFSLITVGSQEQNYKGHDILIEAVGALQRLGYDLSLTLVGDGRLHDELRSQAVEAGIHNIRLIKHLGTSLEVARYVSKHDLFIMPSRTEGMPKALLEAMSVGVLSLGSTVGGIPEVLAEQCTFAPGSAGATAATIRTMIDDKALADEQRKQQAAMIKLIEKEHSGNPVLSRFLGQFVSHHLAGHKSIG